MNAQLQTDTQTEAANSQINPRLPQILAEHLLSRGVHADSIAGMSKHEAILAAGRMQDKALNETIKSVLKDPRNITQIRQQLESLTGTPATLASNNLVQLLNCILAAHNLSPYTGDQTETENTELLNTAFLLAAEAENTNVKTIGRLILEKINVSPATLSDLLKHKLTVILTGEEDSEESSQDSNDTQDQTKEKEKEREKESRQEKKMERYAKYFSGTEQSKQRLQQHIGAWAEALVRVAHRTTEQTEAWRTFVGLYRQIGQAALPTNKMYALGTAILSTINKPQNIEQAAVEYMISMRRKVHEFRYAGILLRLLDRNTAYEGCRQTLARLVIYLLTEKSATGKVLCALNIQKIHPEVLQTALAALQPEKINMSTSIQVFKMIIREHKTNTAYLEKIEQLLTAVDRKKLTSIHIGVLSHVEDLLAKQKAATNPAVASTQPN